MGLRAAKYDLAKPEEVKKTMTARSSSKRQRGQILPMVALLAVVLISIIGLAIDVGRIMVAKAQLVRAVDAAALAGVLQLPDLEAVETEVNLYMDENEPDATVEVPTSPTSRQVEVIAHKNVELTFLKVLTVIPGVDLDDPFSISADAIAGFGILPVDTYMGIDATGSMGDYPCNYYQSNPGCPIKEAKDAASDFVDILLGGSGSSMTQVGVGAFRGCYNPPLGGWWGPPCVPVSSMVEDLTDSESTLQNTIDDIEAEGGTGTNVCLGMYKGEEILFGPNGQTASNTLKIMVLLTDGDNTYNSESYGSGAPPDECRPPSPWYSDQWVDSACHSAQYRERYLDDDTLDMADYLKSQGVEIYVVGFGVCGSPNSNLCDRDMVGGTSHDDYADRNLAKCIASSTAGTNDHYFEVPTAEDLPDVFGEIARQIAFRLIK
jgi:hypothetical protein